MIKERLICFYCGCSYHGGEINKMKNHLVEIYYSIASCKKVPSEIWKKMIEYIKSSKQKNQDFDEARCIEIKEDEVEGLSTLANYQNKKGRLILINIRPRKLLY